MTGADMYRAGCPPGRIPAAARLRVPDRETALSGAGRGCAEGSDGRRVGRGSRLEWREGFDDTRAMRELWELTAAEAARLIRERAISPEDLLKACVARIDATEPSVRAWVHLDREAALRAAGERAQEASEGRILGALHGVPVALKDIFDASGLVTTAGAARSPTGGPRQTRPRWRGSADRAR